MAITLGQTTSSPVTTATFFAAKRINIPVIRPILPSDDLDFCTCLSQCVPPLKVFTDEVGTDFYKNDVYADYLPQLTGGTIEVTLIKNATTETPITDDTYGTYTDNTFLGYFRFEIDFFKVWSGLGYGTYQYIIKNKNTSGTVIQQINSPIFKLMKYGDRLANRTVRIETFQGGNLQHGTNYVGVKGQTFRQQIRLPGKFFYSNDVIENDDLQLNTPTRPTIQIKDQSFPEYTLRIDLVSAPQIVNLLFDYFFANNVMISDYSLFNHVADPRDLQANRYKSVPVKRVANEFEGNGNALKKSYSFTMEYDNRNVFKTNS